ncbi:MAG: alanyl-tRNA editing protein [Oscillospiraceae bacterium]|jgi:alanyl-tRNA synthetase
MPTQKLYLTNPDLLEIEAEVISSEAADGGFWVAVDRTTFFPEGGGQLSDRGNIDGAEISTVRENGGVVYHLCSRGFSPGERVTLRVDKEVRLDHSIQHTGEHMISHAFFALYGINNIGFHMSEELVTIDLDAEVTREQIRAAEEFANRQIWENRRVDIIERLDTELSGLHLRKATDKVKGLLRIVIVEGGDACTCCGTHVSSAGQVGLIKVVRADRHRGGMRIEVVCGRRALLDYQKKHDLDASLRSSLSTENIFERVERLKQENRELASRLRQYAGRLMEKYADEVLSHAPKINGTTLAFALVEADDAEAKQLLSSLLRHEKTLAGVFYAMGERIGYIFSKTPGVALSCRELSTLANGLFNAKGGGSDSLAQGAGKNSKDAESLLEKLREAASRLV